MDSRTQFSAVKGHLRGYCYIGQYRYRVLAGTYLVRVNAKFSIIFWDKFFFLSSFVSSHLRSASCNILWYQCTSSYAYSRYKQINKGLQINCITPSLAHPPPPPRSGENGPVRESVGNTEIKFYPLGMLVQAHIVAGIRPPPPQHWEMIGYCWEQAGFPLYTLI